VTGLEPTIILIPSEGTTPMDRTYILFEEGVGFEPTTPFGNRLYLSTSDTLTMETIADTTY